MPHGGEPAHVAGGRAASLLLVRESGEPFPAWGEEESVLAERHPKPGLMVASSPADGLRAGVHSVGGIPVPAPGTPVHLEHEN